MNTADIRTTYMWLHDYVNKIELFKERFTKIDRNIFKATFEFSIYYFIMCHTSLAGINSGLLLFGYIGLMTSVRYMHSMRSFYDIKLRETINVMDTLYDNENYEELGKSMDKHIETINRYVLLCFITQLMYFIGFTLTLLSVLNVIIR